MYTSMCCDMIAMKREVAARSRRFSVERMSCKDTGDKSLCRIVPPILREGPDPFFLKENEDTPGDVYSHRLSYS